MAETSPGTTSIKAAGWCSMSAPPATTWKRVRQQHLSREEWQGVIKGMISEGAPVTDEELSLIVEYLAASFGPDGKP